MLINPGHTIIQVLTFLATVDTPLKTEDRTYGMVNSLSSIGPAPGIPLLSCPTYNYRGIMMGEGKTKGKIFRDATPTQDANGARLTRNERRRLVQGRPLNCIQAIAQAKIAKNTHQKHKDIVCDDILVYSKKVNQPKMALTINQTVNRQTVNNEIIMDVLVSEDAPMEKGECMGKDASEMLKYTKNIQEAHRELNDIVRDIHSDHNPFADAEFIYPQWLENLNEKGPRVVSQMERFAKDEVNIINNHFNNLKKNCGITDPGTITESMNGLDKLTEVAEEDLLDGKVFIGEDGQFEFKPDKKNPEMSQRGTERTMQ